MLQTIRNAWKIADLRKKLLFTFAILLLYRIGNVVPVPFVNATALATVFEMPEVKGTILGMFNMMSGSAFSKATLFALSIQPYINASIIIQLLTIAIPALERLSKEGGEEGKKKIERITRYTTVALGLLMGWAYWMMLKNYDASQYGNGLLVEKNFVAAITVILSFTAGSALVMWLGEQITEFGIGNGISMILFANIVSRLPELTLKLIGSKSTQSGLLGDFSGTWYVALVAIVGMLALIMLIVFVTNAERRLPVSYAKRVVGRKVYGGQNTFLPIKVNMSGVLPIIFAQSVASLPATIAMFLGKANESNWWYTNVWSNTSIAYLVIYLVLIVAFSYFYATIQYNPVEIANNLRKNGGFIPGYRPGRPTSDFIKRVINKITLFGAIFLGVVAGLPIVLSMVSTKFANMGIGGTSVIIVVGVALETVQAIEAQMLMRHYKGFLE